MGLQIAKLLSFLLALIFIVMMLPLPIGQGSDIPPDQGTRSARTITVNASGGGDYTQIQWALDNASTPSH